MENSTVTNTHSRMMATTDTFNPQNHANSTSTFTKNIEEDSEDVTKLAMSFTMYKIGKWS